MKRCLPFLPFLAILAFCGAALGQDINTPIPQDGGRQFPAKALRGVLQFGNPPEVILDGRPDRLSPGARIHGPTNAFVMSGTLIGQSLVVNFTRESNQLIHEVWLLTPQEASRKGNLATPTRNFFFESERQTGPRDDGKTPFNQLPKFPNR